MGSHCSSWPASTSLTTDTSSECETNDHQRAPRQLDGCAFYSKIRLTFYKENTKLSCSLNKTEDRMETFINWCEEKQAILGKLTLLFGTLMAVIGFPIQIWKTIEEQQCGIHWVLILAPMVIYAVRIPYSIGKKAWALILPDSIGFISCGILFCLFLYY